MQVTPPTSARRETKEFNLSFTSATHERKEEGKEEGEGEGEEKEEEREREREHSLVPEDLGEEEEPGTMVVTQTVLTVRP